MLTLTHALHDAVEVGYRAGEGAGTSLFRYVHAPRVAAFEGPKPYFHPLRTLAGHVVTTFRPHDHVWHKGIMLTCAALSGQNFWGGPTYVRDRGYVPLDNVGRQEHRKWAELAVEGDTATLDERLAWVTAAGEEWVAEERRVAVGGVDADAGCYHLDFSLRLTNTRGESLDFGSPTTEGRPNAGYGGLFWRGPRSFTGGRIATAGVEGPDAMGTRSPWLAFTGKHDGVDAASTLAFLDHPANPRHPTQWFVRSEPFAAASFAFSFDRVLTLPPGETLALRHRILVADGDWSRERVAAHAEAYAREA